ncbi:MAG: hypothetical protein A3D64_01920 [Candidatus Wildermuthbacteria bacterium RIFCSPHIGHO2_02_FULL_49_9]|uniref:Uncharacterized protein n=2 Tax=Candidatus Wildermuthiibacteriota TaxID=1817923 RepID=A0A1G2R2D3_9BACT|nr:MAG: hypothetical protein A2672_01205 [Candidatus Wildermuthbacteria bacterium RIFCSPHIGHO2_01_FULL_49_22b]OHA70949.1 MAG: hypothetical protein A3D64_01920 [Candidatus Wildermuthbacteria bacterium RIFCSPHIGHO2_02_FULL_49_9]
MEQEFITIGEAARLLKQADSVVMRLIKEALQAGVEKEKIMKAEMRQGRMMYLVSKTFLIKEASKEKEAPQEEQAAPSLEKEKEFIPPSEGSMEERMIETLQKIIDTKDQQIEDLSGKIDQLIERDHETNILLKGMQDRLFLLERENPQDIPEAGRKKKS